MTRFIKAFLSITLAVAMAVAGMTFIANAETITSDTILQKFLVVYNMNETTRVTNAETGATGTYFPVHVYTAIDTLKYKEVGIKVTPKYISTDKSLGTQTMWTTTVYSTMKVTKRDGSTQTYTASQLGGNYLFGRELLFNSNNFDALDTEIEIIPYAIDRNGNEIHGKTLVLTDAAIKAREPSSGLFYHETNITPVSETTAEERLEVEKGEFDLSDYFTAVEGKTIDSSKVKVTVSDSTVAGYTANTTDWTSSVLDFNALGDVDVTVKAGSGATKVLHLTVKEFDKFDNKFANIDDYIYRVGNGNNVAMSSLFAASGEGTVNSARVNVAIDTVDGNASGTFTANTTDWTKGNIRFSGNGTVKVTVNEGENIPTELFLEVVDAVNATSATSATSKNVVLLNDCGFSTLSVSNGYTLYGNGFTLTCSSDVTGDSLSAAFVALDNGTLDNVRVICPNFSLAALYNGQLKAEGNVDPNAEWRYYNARSAVTTTNNCKILNSYISGGRNAVYFINGNLTVDNSTIHGGSVANLCVSAAQSLKLRDVNFIQRPLQATVNDTSKILMGFGILVLCDGNGGTSTPITLEGDFVQYVWANTDYSGYVPDGASAIIEVVKTKTAYRHTMALEGGESKDWYNLGIAYMPAEQSISASVVQPTVNDYRTNKDTVPYSFDSMTVLGTTCYVYSYNNSNGTADSFKVIPEYVSEKHNTILPTISYNDSSLPAMTKEYDSDNGWQYTLTADLDTLGDVTFDFDSLVASKGGVTFDYTVTTADGQSVDKTQTITMTDSGVHEYILHVTDDLVYGTNGEATGETVTHEIHVIVVATKTSIEPPVKVADPSGNVLMVVKSKDSDWSIAVPALMGTQIKYYSVADKEYKTLALSSLTPTTAGKQNGTNKYWEYTAANGDFTLKITSGIMQDSKGIYGMPVVVDNNGTKEMYFTISSTNGYVSTKTTARSVTLTYEFADNNGGSLTFSKAWSLARADYTGTQYLYESFASGTLEEAGSGGGCVTPDTLITLADGTQVRVDALTGEEELLVWNMETGSLDSAPIMFVDSDAEADVNVVGLTFSDGTVVDVIYEHGFWDYDLNKYVYLDENAAQYIGHTFAKQNGDALEKVQLVDVSITAESSMAYSPVTAGHLCYFVNGMLSMPGGVGGLFNIFEVDPETMTYDLEAMERDIAEYGLFTYEEMAELVPELPQSMFDAAGGKYLKVSIGKGNLTAEELEAMIIRYTKFF